MGMVFPVSTHNYEIRYWLAAGGLEPRVLQRAGYFRPASAPMCCVRNTAAQMPRPRMEAGTTLAMRLVNRGTTRRVQGHRRPVIKPISEHVEEQSRKKGSAFTAVNSPKTIQTPQSL